MYVLLDMFFIYKTIIPCFMYIVKEKDNFF